MVSPSKIINENVFKIVLLLKHNFKAKFSFRNISKLTGLSYNSCYKTLVGLEKERIIKVEREHGINYSSLQDSNRCGLILAYVSLLESEEFLSKKLIIRKIILELMEKFELEIEVLILFGSYAKNLENPKSDIDLFCITSAGDKMKNFSRHLGMKYGEDIQLIVAEKKDFLEMLAEKKITVGKEALDTGILLAGYENFWKLILKSSFKI